MSKVLRDDFKDVLRKYMFLSGMTYDELAKKAKVTKQSIAHMMSPGSQTTGARSSKLMLKLSKVLNFDINELLR